MRRRDGRRGSGQPAVAGRRSDDRMIRRIGALAVVGVCVAHTAGADELATLVVTDGGQGQFTRELPAGVPVTIQVPIPEADPTWGPLTVVATVRGFSRSVTAPVVAAGIDRVRLSAMGLLSAI